MRPRAAGAVLLALALTAALAVALAAAGCGSAGEAADPYSGSWQRLAGDVPDDDFTLAIAAQGDAYSLTFANQANDKTLTVDGRVEDDALVCTLPTADDGAAAPKWAPALPQKVDVALAADAAGERLTASMLFEDGGRLPLWEYVRSSD